MDKDLDQESKNVELCLQDCEKVVKEEKNLHKPEAHDFEAFDSGSELGMVFGCNVPVVCAFSCACNFNLIFVHIWA